MKCKMSILEAGSQCQIKEEPELLPLAEDETAWAACQQFQGGMQCEEEAYPRFSGGEGSLRAKKRKRADDERPTKRCRLDPFESAEQEESLFSLPYSVNFHFDSFPTVDSITRGIAELTISLSTAQREMEFFARF